METKNKHRWWNKENDQMVSSKYVKYFKNKKILITGGTGLIGMLVAQMLIDLNQLSPLCL